MEQVWVIDTAPGRAAAALRRWGSAWRAVRTMPSTLRSSTRVHSSSALSSTVPIEPIPALETTVCRPPSPVAARSTASRTASSSVTSARRARQPAGAPSGSRSSTATRAPRVRSWAATAAPIPDAPPVTRADSPSKSRAPVIGRSPRVCGGPARRGPAGSGVRRSRRGASGPRSPVRGGRRSGRPRRRRGRRSARGGGRRTR